MGVQVGEGGTQINYYYAERTWADGVVAPPLIDVSGVIDSPYRGLRPFEERDAPFFFGRETAADEVLQRMSRQLDSTGLLVLSGASGAGKSSLLRAGVLPRLRGTGLAAAPRSASWPCLLFSPTHTPLDELAVRVSRLAGTDAAAVRRELDSDPSGFVLTARQAVLGQQGSNATNLNDPRRARRLLLIVDQFEQLFTQCSDEDQRQAFIAALHAAASRQGSGKAPAALVVIGVRADFEARCADYPQLADAVQERYLVTAMTERQLRLAIIEPAKKASARIDDDLVDLLLRELRIRSRAVSGAGALPLLSHALDRAWRGHSGDVMSLADYEHTGGVEGALADSAERAYAQLTPAQRAAARKVFIRLTATGSDAVDTAQRATRKDLTQGRPSAEISDVEAVLEAFAAERLLTLAADTVEISHEVLLTAWPLLRDTWLAETHADRIVLTRLHNSAADWARGSHDSTYLYRGSQLQAATETASRIGADPARYPPLGESEGDFLRASHRAQRRTVRRRLAITATLLVLVLALTAVAASEFVARREALQLRDEATGPVASLAGIDWERFEVTNARYQACVEAGECNEPGLGPNDKHYDDPDRASLPVVSVRATDAMAFCSWIGRRLPTYEEWREAVRVDGRWPWGDRPLPSTSLVNAGLNTRQQSPPPGSEIEARMRQLARQDKVTSGELGAVLPGVVVRDLNALIDIWSDLDKSDRFSTLRQYFRAPRSAQYGDVMSVTAYTVGATSADGGVYQLFGNAAEWSVTTVRHKIWDGSAGEDLLVSGGSFVSSIEELMKAGVADSAEESMFVGFRCVSGGLDP